MVWTKEHAQEAAAKGWGVFEVVEGKKVQSMLLPLQFNDICPHAANLSARVVAAARARDQLSLDALRHISQMNSKA
jgi:hypothetical protein